MTDIENYLKANKQRIEEQLDKLIPDRNGNHQKLFESARYALLDGGKRLRPILAIATAEMVHVPIETSIIPACALEIVHTYSLIHDDLPCMDNDDFRRGKPTVHKKFTEGHAVLTGDYLLTYAFEVLATSPYLSSDKKVSLIATLAKKIGSDGMIGGQVMDIASTGKTLTLDMLQLLHHDKTGALIQASIEFGAILGGIEEKQFHLFSQFGNLIGLAFQIIDDVLDVTSSQEKHGRSVASDIINQKSTYVTLLGIEQSKAYALDLYNQAIQTIKALPFNTNILINLANYVINRKN